MQLFTIHRSNVSSDTHSYILLLPLSNVNVSSIQDRLSEPNPYGYSAKILWRLLKIKHNISFLSGRRGFPRVRSFKPCSTAPHAPVATRRTGKRQRQRQTQIQRKRQRQTQIYSLFCLTAGDCKGKTRSESWDREASRHVKVTATNMNQVFEFDLFGLASISNTHIILATSTSSTGGGPPHIKICHPQGPALPRTERSRRLGKLHLRLRSKAPPHRPSCCYSWYTRCFNDGNWWEGICWWQYWPCQPIGYISENNATMTRNIHLMMMMLSATLFSETHFLSSGFETPPKGLKGYRGGSSTLVPNSLLLLIIIIIHLLLSPPSSPFPPSPSHSRSLRPPR